MCQINALKLIKEHGNIEGVVAHIQKSGKHQLPEPFPFEEARTLFVNPLVAEPATVELKWSEPDTEGLMQYLVQEKQFDEGRVKKAIERLQKWCASPLEPRGRADSDAPPLCASAVAARARTRRIGSRASLAP